MSKENALQKIRATALANPSASSELLDRLEREAEGELTEARLKAAAVRKARVAEEPWPIEAFSPPGAMRTCEHRFLQKLVYGQDDYWCHDCESELSFPQPFGRPKQHIVPVALMKLGWALKYMGAKAVAVGMMRPHTRMDLPGAPGMAPLSVLAEQADQLREVLDYVEEYQAKALENGHNPQALSEGNGP